MVNKIQSGINKNLKINFCDEEDFDNNEVEFVEPTAPSLNNSVVTEETEEVEVSIEEADIINILIAIFNKNPEILGSIKRSYDSVVMTLEKGISEILSVEITMDEINNAFPCVKDFIYLASIGVIVSDKFTNTVPSDVKVFLPTSKTEGSIYIRNTPMGKVYKTIPMISTFSKPEINSVIGKFFKGKFPPTVNADFYGYYISQFQEQETKRRIQELKLDLSVLSDLEVVSFVIENGGFNEFTVKQLKDSNFPQNRMLKIKNLVSLMD